MKHKLIMDVDTGTDDTVALLLAILSPEIDLLAATTVNGNCRVNECTENTLAVFDAMGVSIPVYEGMSEPMVRPDIFRDGSWPNKPNVPPAKSKKQPKHAVDFLIDRLLDSDGDITLVPVGPLSNIAMAMKKEPAICSKIKELVIMGGGNEMGNSTPAAEFNIWLDPEAAKVVFNSGVPIRLLPLDATHKGLFFDQDVEDLRRLGLAGSIAADVIEARIDMYRRTQPLDRPGAPVHDAMCICAILDPSIITTKHVHVDVETAGALTVGYTIMDINCRGKEKPNVDVAFDVDEARFVQMIKGILGSGN